MFDVNGSIMEVCIVINNYSICFNICLLRNLQIIGYGCFVSLRLIDILYLHVIHGYYIAGDKVF